MPLPKISETRDLSDAELAKQILETKQQLFKLRLQKATGRLEKSHQFKHAKHRLAQLLMVEGERQKAAAQGQPKAEQE
ncbi:50S ribosomal protein L29 [[Phormidium ambiguum] IAM M-71]|uniref:Large ribosomal subunit protein uL29 n=1 Tax=[Phormidium ambiguum] IAM M-71 TaxID=454136 RepID=A0A1U7IMJ3_9CYAN|nr:50S ribosomal protein L29 [Phormidium ambiguum]OKH38404.1 50S ribosomal protein L29 [Phormidium ambiguum IAM M-71]